MILIEKRAFKMKMKLLCGPLNTDLRDRLIKCFVWSVAMDRAETWNLGKRIKESYIKRGLKVMK